MSKIIIAPGKYVQGKGEIKKIGEYVKPLGEKPFVVISESGLKRIKDSLDLGFGDLKYKYEVFNGECSKNEVNRLINNLGDCDVVVGIGGGKILDTVKAVAYYAKKSVVIVPTIASTDAPCSALSVLYTDEGQFEEYLFLPANPNVVLIDTDIIASSPARLVVCGMGDALATYFEARACKRKSAGTCAGGTSTKAAFALAELCYNTLISDGLAAKLAAENKVCTPAFENIIEANTLLSGIGFESGGIAGAHSIHNGFTALEECHHMYHGEKVAFGVISQLVLEDADSEEIEEVIAFCLSVGLPVTLEELGVKENIEEKIKIVAKGACAKGESMHNMPFKVTEELVYAAIMGADALGRYYKSL